MKIVLMLVLALIVHNVFCKEICFPYGSQYYGEGPIKVYIAPKLNMLAFSLKSGDEEFDRRALPRYKWLRINWTETFTAKTKLPEERAFITKKKWTAYMRVNENTALCKWFSGRHGLEERPKEVIRYMVFGPNEGHDPTAKATEFCATQTQINVCAPHG